MRHRLELNAIPKLELDAESGAERGDAEGGGGGGSDAAAFDELSAMQGEQIQLSTAVLLLRLLTPRSALCLSQRRCWPPLRCCKATTTCQSRGSRRPVQPNETLSRLGLC